MSAPAPKGVLVLFWLRDPQMPYESQAFGDPSALYSLLGGGAQCQPGGTERGIAVKGIDRRQSQTRARRVTKGPHRPRVLRNVGTAQFGRLDIGEPQPGDEDLVE